MFERFTDRARRVVVLAQEEARMLNHNYIGTEHILLGLIHEGEGFSCDMLQLPSDQPAFEGSNHRGSAAPVFGDCFRGRVCRKAPLGIPRGPSGLGYLEPCWKQRQETTPP